MMNHETMVFAQLTQYIPLATFRRCAARSRGEYKVKAFSCLHQYLFMAFAQLNYRECLRDIEACLRDQGNKLCHPGIRSVMSRNALANDNVTRDWYICADFAQSPDQYRPEALRRRTLWRRTESVYVCPRHHNDRIDICQSIFLWAPFRSAKAAVKPHTLFDLRDNIPGFIHISDGNLHDVNTLDYLLPEPGPFYIIDRTCLDCERLLRFHVAGRKFLTLGKSKLKDIGMRFVPGNRHGADVDFAATSTTKHFYAMAMAR